MKVVEWKPEEFLRRQEKENSLGAWSGHDPYQEVKIEDDVHDDGSCKAGEDFTKACPMGWRRTEGGPNGPECEGPGNFWIEGDFCMQHIGGRHRISAMLEDWQKQELSQKCYAWWPCKGLAQDFTQVCPDGWEWEADGTCKAPRGYAGTCDWYPNFLMFTSGMKATWAKNCKVSWPLTVKDEAPITPAHFPRHAPGKQSSPWNNCIKDYIATCPDGFHKNDQGMCDADPGYDGQTITGCSYFDPRRWTKEMKQAFEGHCHVWWPCASQPVWMQDPQAMRKAQLPKLGIRTAATFLLPGTPPPLFPSSTRRSAADTEEARRKRKRRLEFL